MVWGLPVQTNDPEHLSLFTDNRIEHRLPHRALGRFGTATRCAHRAGRPARGRQPPAGRRLVTLTYRPAVTALVSRLRVANGRCRLIAARDKGGLCGEQGVQG
ncbi:hypothetical protein TUSST3_40270 [Streptomyces sp. TUS-ST3]|nr:hypothetical protein TUSST3_40270 [Streptomyces sp. TUS-ST3]